MEFLGVGPSELLFVIIIALIVLGPKDMQKTGRIIGKWMRKIITSDGWKLFQQTSREIQTLPNRLMREAQLDELKDLQKDLKKPLDVNSIAPHPVSLGVPQPPQSDPAKLNPPSEPEQTTLSSPPPSSSPSDDEVKNG